MNNGHVEVKGDVVHVTLPPANAVRSAEYIRLEFTIEPPKKGMMNVEMWPRKTPPKFKARAKWPYFGYKYAHGCGDSDRSVSTTGDVGGTDTTASTGDW